MPAPGTENRRSNRCAHCVSSHKSATSHPSRWHYSGHRLTPKAMKYLYGWRRHTRAGSTCRPWWRSEEHTSELQSHLNLVCRLLLEKKKKIHATPQQHHTTDST